MSPLNTTRGGRFVSKKLATSEKDLFFKKIIIMRNPEKKHTTNNYISSEAELEKHFP